MNIGLRITITDTKGKRCMMDYSGSQLHWKDVPADTSNDGITLIEEALCFCFMLIFFDFVACAAVITLKAKKSHREADNMNDYMANFRIVTGLWEAQMMWAWVWICVTITILTKLLSSHLFQNQTKVLPTLHGAFLYFLQCPTTFGCGHDHPGGARCRWKSCLNCAGNEWKWSDVHVQFWTWIRFGSTLCMYTVYCILYTISASSQIVEESFLFIRQIKLRVRHFKQDLCNLKRSVLSTLCTSWLSWHPPGWSGAHSHRFATIQFNITRWWHRFTACLRLMHCWNLNFFSTKTRTFALLIPSQFLLTITYSFLAALKTMKIHGPSIIPWDM